MWRTLYICLTLLAAVNLRPAYAQHPIDVQKAMAGGQYFEALSTFDKLPKRTETSASTLAAARSAWALSLPSRATDEFDRALRDENLTTQERARVFLSKGIIEYQEMRYQVAILFAQRALELATKLQDAPSLLSKANYLWAEALSKQRQYGEAEAKYEAALIGAAENDLPQFYFSLGTCRMNLGRYTEAQQNFEKVPQDHELTSAAIRKLAVVAIESDNSSSAQFWLTKGRQSFAEEFLDSWVDYAMVAAAIEQNKQSEVALIRTNARAKYPPSDPWLTLLEAAAEAYEWQRSRAGSASMGGGKS